MTDELNYDVSAVFNDEPTGVKNAEPPAVITEAEPAKVTPPEPEKEEVKSVPITALLEERRKRQLAEDELNQTRKQAAPPIDEPDPAKDPEGYKTFVRSSIVREELEGRIVQSRADMLGKYEDYEKNEKIFLMLKDYEPALVDQMNKHPSPAQFAYEKGKEYLETQRKEIEAQILAEAKGSKTPNERNERAASLPNLNNIAAIGSNSQPAAKALENPADYFADSPLK